MKKYVGTVTVNSDDIRTFDIMALNDADAAFQFGYQMGLAGIKGWFKHVLEPETTTRWEPAEPDIHEFA